MHTVFQRLRSGRPRPAFLEIPIDVLAAPAMISGQPLPIHIPSPDPSASGFIFSGQDLSTAVANKVPVTVVVINDHCYGALKAEQRFRFNGRVVGNDLVSPDFARLAEAYGDRGIKVATWTDVPRALRDALYSTTPTVIESPAPPACPPWIE